LRADLPPTRVRYGVLAFACALSMITYLDRVCMGSAGKSIQADLGLHGATALQMAYTLFGIAYAVFEVPSGWLGDVFGPRKTLIRIVLWWSLFTAITGAVGLNVGGLVLGGIGTLEIVRFLFGMGEAGAYPNITRALHNWFPRDKRGFTQGMVWMSGRLMGGLTPIIWLLLISGVVWKGERITSPLMNWRSAFWLFGILGLVWCGLFARWFRNHPEEKPEVNAAELALINAGSDGHGEAELGGVPWRRILTSGNLWLLCLMYACGAYGWYFNITYLPQYMEDYHGIASTDILGAVYKGGPLWLGAMGCLIGGILSDRYIRRTGDRRWGRRLFGVAGHTLCAISYVGCIYVPRDSVLPFFFAISLAAFFNDLTMGPAWATCQDIGRRYAAIVAGCMNTIGNLGGALGTYVTAEIINHSVLTRARELGITGTMLELKKEMPEADLKAASMRGYDINFMIFAAVYLLAVLCWFLIDSTKPVAPDQDTPPRK
jgi:MFS family permease